jgi:hypothetical protein
MADDLQIIDPNDELAKRPEEGEVLSPKSTTDALIEELTKGKGKATSARAPRGMASRRFL